MDALRTEIGEAIPIRDICCIVVNYIVGAMPKLSPGVKVCLRRTKWESLTRDHRILRMHEQRRSCIHSHTPVGPIWSRGVKWMQVISMGKSYAQIPRT